MHRKVACLRKLMNTLNNASLTFSIETRTVCTCILYTRFFTSITLQMQQELFGIYVYYHTFALDVMLFKFRMTDI